jgi:hypothetical protein
MPDPMDEVIANLRNINTSPGPNAGRSIDPTKPGPDADRAPSPGPQDVREAVDSGTFEEIVHVLTMWRKTERTERWIAQQIVKVLPAHAQSEGLVEAAELVYWQAKSLITGDWDTKYITNNKDDLEEFPEIRPLIAGTPVTR